MKQIIKFNEALIKKGYAYESNGSVYFSVEKFPDYGKLSGRKTDDQIAGARIEKNPNKKNPLDFALWIKAPEGHMLKWESPWGVGYPGWHIECSVMSADLLGGDTFDIHGGGNENMFPHNENEIAQSEACLGKKMANFWALWNMVNIDGTKMSKSLGNFTTIKDALKKYDPAVIRLWIISSHYRSVINFSTDSLDQAKTNLQKISDFALNLEALASQKKTQSESGEMEPEKYLKDFESAMDDDLNTPLALSALFELITTTNKLSKDGKLDSALAKKILVAWRKINSVFGLKLRGQAEIPKEILDLAKAREQARAEKDFTKADEIRQHMEEKGFVVEDSDEGYRIKSK